MIVEGVVEIGVAVVRLERLGRFVREPHDHGT